MEAACEVNSQKFQLWNNRSCLFCGRRTDLWPLWHFLFKYAKKRGKAHDHDSNHRTLLVPFLNENLCCYPSVSWWTHFFNPEINPLLILRTIILTPLHALHPGSLKTVTLDLPSCHTRTQLSNKGFRLQWAVLASWWWSVCTLRISLIGIHTMFVDSLHINRWLCGDNVRHIVLTMMQPSTHQHICCFVVCVGGFNPKPVRGAFINLSFSEKECWSLSGIWAGIPEQMSPRTRPAQICNNKTRHSFAAEWCSTKGSIFFLVPIRCFSSHTRFQVVFMAQFYQCRCHPESRASDIQDEFIFCEGWRRRTRVCLWAFVTFQNSKRG